MSRARGMPSGRPRRDPDLLQNPRAAPTRYSRQTIHGIWFRRQSGIAHWRRRPVLPPHAPASDCQSSSCTVNVNQPIQDVSPFGDSGFASVQKVNVRLQVLQSESFYPVQDVCLVYRFAFQKLLSQFAKGHFAGRDVVFPVGTKAALS